LGKPPKFENLLQHFIDIKGGCYWIDAGGGKGLAAKEACHLFNNSDETHLNVSVVDVVNYSGPFFVGQTIRCAQFFIL